MRYTKKWEEEDIVERTTPEERTKRVLKGTMQGVDECLKFTVESGEKYPDGWLPTLYLSLIVGADNKVMYRFFEKDMCASTTVMKRTAFNENSMLQIVSNDLVRRLTYTMEQMGEQERNKVVDQYGQKLLNSGYSLEQTRHIWVNGIKGFEGKKRRCQLEGRKLFRKTKESMGARWKKKLVARSSWYKGAAKKNWYAKSQSGGKGSKIATRVEQQSVLFVEQTEGGELARSLR